MESTTSASAEKPVKEGAPEKKSLGKMFMNFLMMGGFIVILILAVVIIILVEKFLA